jgi:alanine racemase
MPAVKADAYGHGAVECARALERLGADWFGVALPEEGAQLRDAGIAKPILCLGAFWPGQERMLIERGLTTAVFDIARLQRLDRAARSVNAVVDFHLKVDTGMGRLGVPTSELPDFLEAASTFRNVRLDGVMTHFASADLPDKAEFTRQQMARFQAACEMIRARGHRPTWVHQSNSAAAHAYPVARGNMVRLGGVLYGLWRDSTNPSVEPFDWKPVMSVHSRVAFLKTVPPGTALGYGNTYVTGRESLIATLPVGYEDGLRRSLSSRGKVIVRGRMAPIVGRISMDLTLIDVTDVPGVAVGDLVTLIGRQGDRQISAEEVAVEAGTMSYEVTCGFSPRVPRVYLES